MYAAIVGNSVVMVAKFGAFLVTGSGALLSEAIHSLADVMNQGLLAVGIHSSERDADPAHPYGFGQARFAWALVSAVGIFFLGSGATIYHGIASLLNPSPVADHNIALLVLGVSFLVEGGTLLFALKAVHTQATAAGVGIGAYVWRGRDPMAVSVLLEDSAAVLGLVIAAGSVAAAQITGSSTWDAVGSLLIGLLLGVIAVFLIRKNMQYLLGRSIRPELQARIVHVLEQQDSVESVHDVKATVLGAEHVHFKAEIEFDGRALARRYLQQQDLKTIHSQLTGPDRLETFLLDYGDQIVQSLGDEVDRIEDEIRREVPDAQYVDLETN